jgi:hypothetical protein
MSQDVFGRLWPWRHLHLLSLHQHRRPCTFPVTGILLYQRRQLLAGTVFIAIGLCRRGDETQPGDVVAGSYQRQI